MLVAIKRRAPGVLLLACLTISAVALAQAGPPDEPRWKENPGQVLASLVRDPMRDLSAIDVRDLLDACLLAVDASGDTGRRRSAVLGLSGPRWQHIAVVPVLSKVALDRSLDEYTRQRAVRAIGYIAAPEAVEALLRLQGELELTQDNSEALIRQAQEALAAFLAPEDAWSVSYTAAQFRSIWEMERDRIDLRQRALRSIAYIR